LLVDGVLDLGGAEAVAAHVDHIVHATDDAVAAVGIALGAVAGEVVAGVAAEVGLAAALVVAPGGADHAIGHGNSMHSRPSSLVLGDLVAPAVSSTGCTPGSGRPACAGFIVRDVPPGR
jgi:hypothetical protein